MAETVQCTKINSLSHVNISKLIFNGHDHLQLH